MTTIPEEQPTADPDVIGPDDPIPGGDPDHPGPSDTPGAADELPTWPDS